MLVQGQHALSALVVYLHDPVVGRGAPLQGPKSGLVSNTQKRIV